MKQKLYRIHDGSYSLSITEKGLEHKAVAWERFEEINEYEIIAESCCLPADEGFLDKDHFNNIIVRNIITGTIVFTQKRFVREIKEQCPNCGRVIN